MNESSDRFLERIQNLKTLPIDEFPDDIRIWELAGRSSERNAYDLFCKFLDNQEIIDGFARYKIIDSLSPFLFPRAVTAIGKSAVIPFATNLTLGDIREIVNSGLHTKIFGVGEEHNSRERIIIEKLFKNGAIITP